MIKKLIFNIFLLCVIFLSVDFYCFKKSADIIILPKSTNILQYYWNFISRDISEKNTENMIINNVSFHPVLNKNSNEKPIVIFGCSFVYGHLIPENKTFYKVLSKYTSRPIYDRSRSGWGISQMLYQLKNERFYKIINKEPEMIIYNYIPDHIRRLYIPCMYAVPEYIGGQYNIFQDKINGGYYLKNKVNSSFYKRFNIVTKITDRIYFQKTNDEKRIFLLRHFLEAKKESGKHWKNTKFVIIEYFSDKIFDSIKNDLQKAGFIVVNRNNLVEFQEFDKRYCLSETDHHPNEKAWDTIIPKLLRYLKNNENCI